MEDGIGIIEEGGSAEEIEEIEEIESEDEETEDAPKKERNGKRVRLNPDDYEEYSGEKSRDLIGREAAFVGRDGRLRPCRIAGYYYEGGWLVAVGDSTIADKVDAAYFRKNEKADGTEYEPKGGEP